MQSLAVVLALCALSSEVLALTISKKKLDINQKVTVEGVAVLGGAAGEGALGQASDVGARLSHGEDSVRLLQHSPLAARRC